MRLLGLSVLTLSIILSNTHNSYSAGFSTDLHSTSSLGNSNAGAVVGSHDISDSFSNPSILSAVKNKELVLSLAHLNSDIDDDNANATYGSAFGSGSVTGGRNNDGGIENALIPAFYYANRINDKLVFGLNVTAPYALATKYDDNWVGRYHAIKSNMESTNINPSIAYGVNEKLSVGFGLQAQYIKTVLTKAVFDGTNDHIGKLKADDLGFGYNFGADYKINERSKIAFGYRSKIDHKLEGKSQVQGLNMFSDITANITTPESFIIGASYNINDKIELLSDISWARWSRLQVFDVVAPQNSTLDGDDLEFHYKDSWKYSLGLNYQMSNNLKIRAGTAYEEGANSSSTYRSPRVPTGDRIWASLGFEYRVSDNLKINTSYLHQFYKKTSTNIEAETQTSSLDTNYKTKVDVFALGMRLSF
jgi:long-chain fatty acid transport protein